jgi:plasmid stabilization system protein ParE
VKRLVVSDIAKSDLATIRIYSRDRRGKNQAEQYIELIIACFAWLMTNSARGSKQRRDHRRPASS